VASLLFVIHGSVFFKMHEADARNCRGRTCEHRSPPPW